MPDMPAARATDPHVCPMFTGLVAHGGGPILPPCEPTVETGDLKQARISDMATCVGPPDVIAQGASTVTVRGLFAARMVDPTVHGGIILMGLPTVIIGGPVFTARPVKQTFWGNFKYGSSITIETDSDDPNFASQTIAALIRLDSTPTGNNIINAIEKSGNDVTIEKYSNPKDPYNATTNGGNGGDSTIAWDPAVNGFGPPGTTPGNQQPGSDVILGHEMTHAAHNATGTADYSQTNSDGTNVREERNTTGLPAQTYNRPGDPLNGTALPNSTAGAPGQPYTENQLRQDYANRGIPSPVTGNPPDQRPSYYRSGTPF
jgi:uncharacterized Zn-binding protein involved in type VI secretion